MSLKLKVIVGLLIFMLGGAVNLFFSTAIHQILSNKNQTLRIAPVSECLSSILANRQHLMLFLCFQGFFALLAVLFVASNSKPYQSELKEIAPGIKTPAAVGQHQHGSAQWLSQTGKDNIFDSFVLNTRHPTVEYLIKHGYDDFESSGTIPDVIPKIQIKSGGVVLGQKRTGSDEKIYYVGDDTHTLTIGATRSGKSRTIVLQSICLLGLAEESLVVSDPKAELFHYSAEFLQRLGYEIITLDFKNPEKSHRYNLLQPIIDAVKAGNMDKAEMLAWDMTNTLVGKETGNSEKLWHNGEMSIIAAGILCVVCDNVKRPEYQNLTNVYWFLAEMCKQIGNRMPLLEYVKKLPQSHPARALMSISDVAPSRTRGSFYTSALTSLRLFTARSINAITSSSDFSLTDVGHKKQAVFIILPDEKTTFYPVASLIVSQQYELLANYADMRGGRLEKRVNFMLDEFGNFVPINDFTNKLTVGGGRGMRFNLFLQSFEQLKEKYSDSVSNTIKSNCQTWIYLQADDKETLHEISEKLGSYTTGSYQLSSNHQKFTMPSSSHTSSLLERKLLTTDEVRRVSRPYQIVTSRTHPAMMYSPDISEWHFNKMMGLGDKEHNRVLREERESKRPIISDISQDVILWNVWVYYQKDIARQMDEQRRKKEGSMIGSFLSGETDF